MTVTEIDHMMRPEPRRDRWGRYLIEGKSYQRVTTFCALVEDRFNLEKWGKRMVALGLVDRPDLLMQIAAHRDDNKKVNKFCDDALEAAKGSSGSNLGTALHSFTEQVDLGLDPIIPAPYDADVAAYKQTLAANGIHIDRKFVERIVVSKTDNYAGTFDRLVTIDGWDKPVIADLKTGASLDFGMGGIAIQLACYANAEHIYDVAKDKCLPMPDVDKHRALVIHLPAGQANCTLHVVDIGAGWAAASICASVREWRSMKNLSRPFTVETGETRAAYLRRRVETLRAYPAALELLAKSWPLGVPTFKQSSHQTAEQLEQIALVLDHVRSVCDVPFDETDKQHPTDNQISEPKDTAA